MDVLPDFLAEPETCVGEGAEGKALGWRRLSTNEGKVAKGGIVAIFEPSFVVVANGIDGEVISEPSGDGMHAPDELGPWVKHKGDQGHR